MKLLDRQGLRAKGINWSRAHIWRLERAGKFPRHVKLGENTNAWIEAEIDAWLEALKAARHLTAEAAA